MSFIPEVGKRFMATHIGGRTKGPYTRVSDHPDFPGKISATNSAGDTVFLDPDLYVFMDAPEKTQREEDNDD